jgi:hypothetical protein
MCPALDDVVVTYGLVVVVDVSVASSSAAPSEGGVAGGGLTTGLSSLVVTLGTE